MQDTNTPYGVGADRSVSSPKKFVGRLPDLENIVVPARKYWHASTRGIEATKVVTRKFAIAFKRETLVAVLHFIVWYSK